INESISTVTIFFNSGFSQLAIYLAKRDYVDHVEFVEPVEGVILIDPEYQKEKKVFVTLTCAFRYGRDDMELIGLSFRKDLYALSCQLYPPCPEDQKPLTPLQEKLKAKLGANSFPFCFNACGVDYEVKGFWAENVEEKVHKRNSVRLIIRKVQYAPEITGPAPRADTTRQFMMSDRPLQLEASLEKEIYYHGEPININVKINNTTSKIVKKIKITVEQVTDVVLYSLDKYTKPVCTEEINDTVAANSSLSRTYSVTPLLANNREKRGLALDGKLKHGDTNLASSTVLRPGMDKEVMGLLVSYKVKINLMVSRGGYVPIKQNGHLSALCMRAQQTDVLTEDTVDTTRSILTDVEKKKGTMGNKNVMKHAKNLKRL
uniref:Arrestin-C n=1 Tax=Leptobrachium leishanense TaxID=445787 RepID=A0A8C5MMY9_9ANUR